MTTTLKGSADRLEVGGWAASSNVWNPGGYRNGKDFTQSIAIDEATFPNGTVISWSWPYDSRRTLTYENYPVRAYPELTHGVNPWNGTPSTSMDLPARIADLPNFDVTYKVGLTGATNLYNVAVSLWIGDDPKKGIEGVTDEVMVWLHSGFFTPAGEPIAKLTDAQGDATLWNKPVFSGGVDGNPIDWEYTVLQYGDDRLAGTLDLDGLLDELQTRGIVSKTDWILGFQFGAEVAAGAGSMTIEQLSVDFTASPSPVLTPTPAPAAVATPPEPVIGMVPSV
ncbi:hypothetical protein ABAZ39_31220 (plasmid) [Azospirillum argentinense]|uniref:Glycosyl hydrolase family 12 n=1 Tax=Azospirillum argentinense TaxID=2970906 RepID=A0A060DR51_9PROT|nr:hypothetical protein [Azospirillum argentinense]AIB16326.1 hypothetical protein ABAZ39_31220 [Azospirillum argentinense]EZQ02942.1 hypothetical protein ABAZ39_30260 [Azospirillum argentinense]